MSDKKFESEIAPILKWDALEAEIKEALNKVSENIQLDDTPPFPLVQNVPMSEDHEYEKGNLSFYFKDFDCLGIEDVKLNRNKCRRENNLIHIGLIFQEIRIDGHYSIDAKKAPDRNLDTGGNLMEFSDNGFAPLAAGAEGDDSSLTPEQKEAYLNQAREQRSSLMKTTNGQQLMQSYEEHNEVYNTAFSKNLILQRQWKANGVTAAMSEDTSQAIKNKTVINQKVKKYSGGLTYNQNAFTQQLNVAIAAAMEDPKFSLFKPMQESKYTKAATAALSFAKVVATTGNTKEQMTEVTPDHVFQAVDAHAGELPAVSLSEMQTTLMQQEMKGGGSSEETNANSLILDEEDRKHVRQFIAETMKQKEAEAMEISTPVWQGKCKAVIDRAEAEIEIIDVASNPSSRDVKVSVTLPAFDFDIEDEHWKGKTADIVRQRLSKIYFVKGLLHDQIAGQLKRRITRSISDVYEIDEQPGPRFDGTARNKLSNLNSEEAIQTDKTGISNWLC